MYGAFVAPNNTRRHSSTDQRLVAREACNDVLGPPSQGTCHSARQHIVDLSRGNRPVTTRADRYEADALATIGIDLDRVRERVEAVFGPHALSGQGGQPTRGRVGRLWRGNAASGNCR